jgi:hypothetical protein
MFFFNTFILFFYFYFNFFFFFCICFSEQNQNPPPVDSKGTDFASIKLTSNQDSENFNHAYILILYDENGMCYIINYG